VGFGGGPVVYREDLPETERAREAVQAETDKALAEVGEPRPESVTVKAVHGFPAEVLIDASRDADMIVLGQRGVGGFSRLLMGSVTSQVAHHATCPVLIVPSEHR
jgi:nucleotide-binding universal stress UspA family protein